ncbi:NAD(P)-dependent oxidoreductase [Alphaproteobacteria bacterium]|nr:NAD(P)-dependent oxidoreductase [Alphaproteobacteria bacterium]
MVTTLNQNRKALLIGGAGYIGPVIAEELLNCGYSVRCLDILLYNNGLSFISLIKNQRFEFVRGDFSDKKTLNNALEGVTDVVVLGGLVGDPITKKYPDESKLINDDGIKEVIDTLGNKNVGKVVFISTCSNYGLIEGNTKADENFELNPLSLYAKSKVRAEHYLMEQQNKVDYSASVLRFATAFGIAPRMRFDLTVNEFVKDLYEKGEILVYDADTWRPYCHVNDFGRLVRMVLDAPEDKVHFQTFNAGGDENNYTKRMLVNNILELLPAATVRYQEHGGDPRNYKVSFDKVKDALGFSPKYSVEFGIKELLSALEGGVFDNSDAARNFHGNYEIQYSRPVAVE